MNSLNSPSNVPDFRFLKEVAVEQSESRFSKQTEAGHGVIQCHAENSFLLLPKDDNNNNTKKDEAISLDN